jgi:hypothetical protein
MQWICHYWDEDDTLSCYEVGDDGYVVRQVVLAGAARRPVTAAVLAEVLAARDGGSAEMGSYEGKYGVLAEGDVRGWSEDDGVVEISAEEFDRAWWNARQALD